jgi:hypothetical protein
VTMVEVIGAVAAAGVLMVIMASGERQVEMRVLVGVTSVMK